MQFVPVIDLKGGEVVRAFKGERAAYRPIVTPLAASCAPADVVAGFLALHPFQTIYVADLDAIEGRPGNGEAVLALAARFPNVRFWIDDGARDEKHLRRWLDSPGVEPVLGSESLASGSLLRDFSNDPRVVLSLDFRGEDFLGPRDILDEPALWPERVIVMTLARVGAFEGPDIERLAALARMGGSRKFFAAGGVRDAADIDALKRAGAAGALVASALHDGRLSASDLRRASPME